MRRMIYGAAALAAVVVSSQLASARTSFDGRWSIEVVTEAGDCDRAFRYPVAVEDGKVRNAGSESVAISGSVAPNGAVNGSIAFGNARADVKGRLAGPSGRGSWRASGSRTCSGYWVAEKRG